jgi:transcriptional regulator with GAF, ATPase, and Fis domain
LKSRPIRQDSADLERRLQNLTEKLLSTFEELDFVHSLAQVLANPGEVGDIDAYLLRETITIFQADGGWIARREPSGRLVPSATSGFKASVPHFLLEHLVEPLAAARALPFLTDDLPRVMSRRGLTPHDRNHLPRGLVVCPLALNTEVLGVIALGKRKPGGVFTAGDQKLLSTLAVQAALFMKNADLLSRLEAEAKSLGRRVELLEADARGRPDISMIQGPSTSMRRMAQQVQNAAGTDATVLLLGETGTGKSLVARILHGLSGRSQGPFVEINCGAIPRGLIESELFGHGKGAFTGADKERPGMFEEARGGTILLDEVAELPLESQVKLLSVLEQHRVRRVGENKDRSVDVRVVAATNSDLPSAVREGRFREDLFYRLNVISLILPPLRQRREDILPLARRFLEDLARETNPHVTGFTPRAEETMLSYPWPGNARELRNAVERSLLLKTSGDRIDRDDLLFLGITQLHEVPSSGEGHPLSDRVREFEKQVILEALRLDRGSVAKAATRLGISRTNLHNKLRKHQLLRESIKWSDVSHKI